MSSFLKHDWISKTSLKFQFSSPKNLTKIGKKENFSYYFFLSFLFTARRQPFISGKAHQEEFFNSFLYFVFLRSSQQPTFIQMFCVENCFIGDEWKAAPKWLMKNIMRQSDTNFLFLLFLASCGRRKKFSDQFFFLCFMLGYF